MSYLFQPFAITDFLTLGWSAIKVLTTDCYQYFFHEEAIVHVNSGRVKGFRISASYGYKYYNFLGIPYAKPPVGNLRFKDPQPFEPSSDDEIINSFFSRRGSMPCQPDLILSQVTIGTENCLHLSVYTHDLKPATLKPCMVYIHGGAFIYGAGTKDPYNPELLLRKDIVLVAINYRLGVFGFLSLKHPDLGIPGNAGLKDQSMALKWVKENCMHFGGDPDNITIFGESAGSSSVSLHLVSEYSKNLFHKAIMMSGCAYAPWTLYPDQADYPQRLAKKLGWNGIGGELGCLRTLQRATQHAIIQASDKFVGIEDLKQIRFIPFTPVLEPYESPQCFIREFPSKLMSTAWSKHVPVIFGLCSDEGLIFYKMLKSNPDIEKDFNWLKTALYSDIDITHVDEDKCDEINKRLEIFYCEQAAMTSGIEPDSEAEKAPFSVDFHMILHDKGFAHPQHRMVLERNKHQYANTYLLRFDFESEYSALRHLLVGKKGQGVCHGDDMSYYFRILRTASDAHKNSYEWKTIDRMCEIMTTFAATGDPNNESIAPTQWHPCTNGSTTDDQNVGGYKFLNLSSTIYFIEWPDLERIKFWDDVFEEIENYNASTNLAPDGNFSHKHAWIEIEQKNID